MTVMRMLPLQQRMAAHYLTRQINNKRKTMTEMGSIVTIEILVVQEHWMILL
jgi:hypothetical protein